MLKDKIKILICLWYHLSYEDKSITNDEYVDIAYLLTNSFEELKSDDLKELDLKSFTKNNYRIWTSFK